MDYRKFYIAIRRYAEKEITREEFCADWKYAQLRNAEAEKRNGLKGTVPA
jgi:hypothetical protein